MSEQSDTWAELRRKLPANLARQAHVIRRVSALSTSNTNDLVSPVWRNSNRSSSKSCKLRSDLVPQFSSAAPCSANDDEPCSD